MLDYLRYVAPWYLLTVLLESPWILFGVRGHGLKTRVAAAFLLTAATYPFVIAIFPMILPTYTSYVVTSEVFATAAEPLFFWVLFDRRTTRGVAVRNAMVIAGANVFSYLCGEALKAWVF